MPGTLVMDVSGRIPMDVYSLEDAVVSVMMGKSFPLSFWDGILFRSQHKVFEAPKVVCLREYIELPKHTTEVVTNNLLFARDFYRCQYCGLYHRKYRPDISPDKWLPKGVSLTKDHVKPTSRFKGATNAEKYRQSNNWENAVTACFACNHLKGNKTPMESGMYPLKTPTRPHGVMLTFPEKLDIEQFEYVKHLLD